MDENMSSDSASIHSTLHTILTEVRGLGTDVRGLASRFDRLELRVESVEVGLSDVRQELGGVKQELSQFKKDTSEMWREIGARIDERSAEIRGELTTFTSKMRYEIAETRRLGREALTLESRAAQAQIDDLDGRVSAIERRMIDKPQG